MTVVYDGSFEGLLTAVFEIFEYKIKQPIILPEERHHTAALFEQEHQVITNAEKAQRVLTKLEENLGKEECGTLLRLYLSEQPNREQLFLYAVQQTLLHPKKPVLQNYGDDHILSIAKIRKSMTREVHRMHAFIRFERLQDDLYYAKIDPDFNVLPLIFKHFKARYADQRWMIYDLRRQYGVMYDLSEINFFYPEGDQILQLENSRQLHHEQEHHYQKMWQNYFVKTGIPARKNMKLHLQHVPRRYWKYLTEKV